MTNVYDNESQIAAVVAGLELCTTDKAEFKHGHHLTVAVSYLTDRSVEQATEKMRTSLSTFLDYHGVDRRKYNETMTVFWMEMVHQVIDETAADLGLVEKCNRVIRSLSNPALVFQYYSAELLSSDEARARFVNPDLKERIVWEKREQTP